MLFRSAAVLLSSAVFTVAAADPDPAAKVKIVRETDTVSGDITQKIQVTGAFPVDFAGRKVTLTISDPKAAEGEDLEKYLGIREMRKHVAWYTKGLPGSAKLREEINRVEPYAELENLLYRQL